MRMRTSDVAPEHPGHHQAMQAGALRAQLTRALHASSVSVLEAIDEMRLGCQGGLTVFHDGSGAPAPCAEATQIAEHANPAQRRHAHATARLHEAIERGEIGRDEQRYVQAVDEFSWLDASWWDTGANAAERRRLAAPNGQATPACAATIRSLQAEGPAQVHHNGMISFGRDGITMALARLDRSAAQLGEIEATHTSASEREVLRAGGRNHPYMHHDSAYAAMRTRALVSAGCTRSVQTEQALRALNAAEAQARGMSVVRNGEAKASATIARVAGTANERWRAGHRETPCIETIAQLLAQIEPISDASTATQRTIEALRAAHRFASG